MHDDGMPIYPPTVSTSTLFHLLHCVLPLVTLHVALLANFIRTHYLLTPLLLQALQFQGQPLSTLSTHSFSSILHLRVHCLFPIASVTLNNITSQIASFKFNYPSSSLNPPFHLPASSNALTGSIKYTYRLFQSA